MNLSRTDYVRSLFIKLEQICPDRSWEWIDTLAIVSLRIARALFPKNGLYEMLSKNLSVIIGNAPQYHEEAELFLAFNTVDQSVERHLRGFSSMLNAVLEDVSFEKDPAVLLNNIDVDTRLKHDFLYMAQLLEAYADIDGALDLKAHRSAIVLFLLGFIKIVCHRSEKSLSAHLIESWIKHRTGDPQLFQLYKKSCRYPLKSKSRNREYSIVMLCQKMAQGGRLYEGERKIYDTLLKASGLMGVGPFVESGFLVVEDCAA